MAVKEHVNTSIKSEINTGFGSNAANYGGRLVNKQGKANIELRGTGFLERTSWYHFLLALNRWKFLGLIFLFFLLINICFAVVYSIVGIEHLDGIRSESALHNFAEAFFFSCQTFTTVGYGRISPHGLTTSFIASFEALLGLLSFALATGLLYGRFAKPKAYIRFSHNAIIAPYKDGRALMMRLAPYKHTILLDGEAKVTLGITLDQNGKTVNQFYSLPLEFSTANVLSLNWTLVHPINEKSPLFNFTQEDFASTRGELLLFLKAFDDMFSNTVVARTSYTFNEIVYGARYLPMYHRSEAGDSTVLELDKLNSFEKVALPDL
jgi:inward rectifier potassium channel